MQAIILVGGKGTRLRPLTQTKPKPIVTLVDRPFISYMLQWLVSHGVTEAVMACGFGPGQIQQAIGDGSAYGIKLSYVHEPEPLDTAGAVAYAAAQMNLHEQVAIINGDILTDLDLSAQRAQHESTGAAATIGLVQVQDPSAYGLVLQNQDQSVSGFLEKPQAHQLQGLDTYNVSSGIYILSRQAILDIPQGRPVSIERETWPGLVDNGLYAFQAGSPYWKDIGTHQRYIQACLDIVAGDINTQVTDKYNHIGLLTGRIDEQVKTSGTVLVDGAFVGQGTTLDNCTIAEGAVVGANCVIRNSVIMSDVVVGEGSTIEDTILCQGSHVGVHVHLTDEVVVGENAEVADGQTLQGTKIPGVSEKAHSLQVAHLAI